MRIADHGGLAGRARRRMQARQLLHRAREQAERILVAQIALDRERQPAQVVQRAQVAGVAARRSAAAGGARAHAPRRCAAWPAGVRAAARSRRSRGIVPRRDARPAAVRAVVDRGVRERDHGALSVQKASRRTPRTGSRTSAKPWLKVARVISMNLKPAPATHGQRAGERLQRPTSPAASGVARRRRARHGQRQQRCRPLQTCAGAVQRPERLGAPTAAGQAPVGDHTPARSAAPAAREAHPSAGVPLPRPAATQPEQAGAFGQALWPPSTARSAARARPECRAPPAGCAPGSRRRPGQQPPARPMTGDRSLRPEPPANSSIATMASRDIHERARIEEHVQRAQRPADLQPHAEQAGADQRHAQQQQPGQRPALRAATAQRTRSARRRRHRR